LGIPLLLAALVWRFGAWALVLATILGLLMLLSLVSFRADFSLIHPESFLDFVPSILSIVGLTMGVVGAIVALVQRRRGMARAEASPSERRAVQTILAALGVLVLLSGVLTLTGRTVVPAEAKAGALPVQIKDFTFTPGHLEAKAGETVRLVVSNADSALHTFTIRELGVDYSIAPGNEALIEFRAPGAGIYTWVCIPHEGGMKGTLVVK
jgi:plastocyanin